MTSRPIRRPVTGLQSEAAMTVKCPHCNAQPGIKCATPSGKHTLPDPHPSRVDAAPVGQPAPTAVPSNVIPLFPKEPRHA